MTSRKTNPTANKSEAMERRPQPYAQAPSAGERKAKMLVWSEDFIDLGNYHCPFCGERFKLYDTVFDLVTDVEGVLGNVIITVHYECLRNAMEDDDP